MDLVWETSDGCVIIDYKNYPGFDNVTDAKSKFYAGKYGPQLNAYRRGLENQGTKVLDTLIFYSVQGRLVRVL